MRLSAALLVALAAASTASQAQQAPSLATPKAGQEATSAPPADPFKNAGRPESHGGDVQQPGANTAANPAQAIPSDVRQSVEAIARTTLTAQQYGNLASMRHTSGAMHDLGDRMVVTNSRINKALGAMVPDLRTNELMDPGQRSTFDALARRANENEFAVSVAQRIVENYPRAIADLERVRQGSQFTEVASSSLPELRTQLADAQRLLQTASNAQNAPMQGGQAPNAQPSNTGSVGQGSPQKSD